jgi:hypothetical protein
VIDIKYFKEYRQKLGFNNQDGVKKFFGAKDITPNVDYNYIDLLNLRLTEIVKKMDSVVNDYIKLPDLDYFIEKNISQVFAKLKENNIINKFNNQGRRPEEVYFSWMRGFVISAYFLKPISLIFGVDEKNINLIGDDDFGDIETFKRTPKADLEVILTNNKKVRIEVQSGFQGINDIKQHKVLEAKKINRELGFLSVAIHFDLFNGQVAFVQTNNINDEDINWITRQQMEGQTVFNIDQNYFIWKLTDSLPEIKDFLNY